MTEFDAAPKTGNKIRFRIFDYTGETAAAEKVVAGFYYDIVGGEDDRDPERDEFDYLAGPYPTHDAAVDAARLFIMDALGIPEESAEALRVEKVIQSETEDVLDTSDEEIEFETEENTDGL